MKDGQPSETARRVAAYRLAMTRPATSAGDPEAERRLAADVAGDRRMDGPMAAHLAARTAFVDAVVLGALEAGVGQVVLVGAGYDGRALRFAADGVRFFEVDHPATQADKRARLERLGIDDAAVGYVALDFSTTARPGGPAGDVLVEQLVVAGLERAAATVFVLEGVAPYVEPAVLAALLGSLRAATTSARSRLVATFARATTDPLEAERRRAFARAVAALDEPILSAFTPEELDAVVAGAGWREAPEGPGATQPAERRVGRLVLEPVGA